MTAITTSTVDLAERSRANGGSQNLTAFVAQPAEEGIYPAVVLIMEIFGINDDMRAHAERVASWGYVVVAPDLYADGGARRCLAATMKALATGRGKAITDIETARQWVTNQPNTTDSTGAIGFCMGGGFALLTCDSERYQVASANYGRVPQDLGHACPVVGSYGERDLQNKGATQKLRDKLDAAGVAHDIKEYPDTGHAFLNDELPGPKSLAPLLHIAGFGGSKENAADAWKRTEDFFATYLKS